MSSRSPSPPPHSGGELGKPAPRWVGRALVILIVAVILYMVAAAIYLRVNHRELEKYATGPARPEQIGPAPTDPASPAPPPSTP